MYPRLLLNLCERSLYRASNCIRLDVKRLSNAANKNEKNLPEVNSTKFPDYKVIYIFPSIKQVCALNVVKNRFTVLSGVAAPVLIGLKYTNILSFETSISLLLAGILMVIWLHTLGIFCNRLIGYIYFKADEQKVILSYIDYWGKRIDLMVPVNEITPLSENPRSITDPLYRKVIISSQKKKLKINTKIGQITDINNFTYVLGMV
ncbi:hypothetical protein P5V15_007418 [Pogonomyrmex californicus]